MQYVALLRGINVGGNKKIDMKELKKCFESLRFEDVSTYINSGNVLFSSEHIDVPAIEKRLEEIFGFSIPVLVRSMEDIIHLAKSIPENWENNNEQKTDILFLYEEYDSKESINLIKTNPEIDRLLYIKWAIVWNIFKSEYSKSGMNEFIKSKLYKNMTARNVNTVSKLAQFTQ